MTGERMTIGEAQARARKKLKKGGVEAPGLDADVLLAFVTGLDRAGLYRERERVLTPREESVFFSLTGRREKGEPVAYLTGEKEFMGLSFAVTPDVLIPRPETELLVETALALCSGAGKGHGPAAREPEEPGQQGYSPVLVDVGAGSGAIAVSLAVNIPRALVYATDTAPAALAVARKNAARHGVGNRIRFICGDLLEPLAGSGLAGLVDLVAANLPYLTGAEMAALPRDVRYEPLSALNGGADGGLSLYRRLAPQAEKYLRQGGHLLIEIGPEQARAAMALFPGEGWGVSVKRDLAGRNRLIIGKKKGSGLTL